MAESDIRVADIKLTFSNEAFRTPLKLSTGDISEITYVLAEATVENRRGQVAKGVGGILLSDLWAFPTPLLTHLQKDELMREIVGRMANELMNMDGFYDPMQLSLQMEECRRNILQKSQTEKRINIPITKLTGLVCWSPLDAALHDGWSKAMGLSAYGMYNREFLNDDLAAYLGEGWEGLYPEQFLSSPKKHLWVQHVVGGSDLLTSRSPMKNEGLDDGLPCTLSEWIARDGVRWFKLKVTGTNVKRDLQRILDVYHVAAESLEARGIKEPVLYEIDPNEACPDPEPMIELLRKLKETDQAAYRALVYIEQPTPRQLSDYRYTIHEISKHKPVLVDESLEDMENLKHLERLGWNGVALKTCKGQSHALASYCWAKKKGLFIAIQDLTNPGYSLVQSANLSSHMSLSCNAFEYNSRQYAPFCRMGEREPYSELFHVQNGQISLGQIRHLGLY